MTRMRFLSLALVLSTFTLGACDDADAEAAKKKCGEFAEHVVKVVVKEKGEEVPEDIQKKMLEKTTEDCAADPPSESQFKCGLEAQTTKDMKACDEAEKDKEKEG